MTEEVTGAPEGETPATTETPDSGQTIAETPEPQEREVQPDWSDDWREKITGGDEKAMKLAGRYQSPKDIMKALVAANQKISSGEYKADLPENATEEQIAEYRKARGIPETPDGYLEKLPDGVVIGDDDKDMVKSYVESVHGLNADPAVVAKSLAWYQDLKEQQIAAQAERDKAARAEYEDALRAEWGGEFRGNLNSIMNFLDAAPSTDDGTPLKDLLLSSRMGDGTPLGDHPAFLKWMAQMANDANPAGFVAPGSAGTQADSIADEINEIKNVMRTDRARYNKDTKMQERYRTLLAAQQKLSA